MDENKDKENYKRYYEQAWINLALAILIAMNLVQGILSVITAVRLQNLYGMIETSTQRLRVVEEIIVDTAKQRTKDREEDKK